MTATESHQHRDAREEMEAEIGEQIKRYRINKMVLDQETFASRAGISVRTLRNLERGNGSSLSSYLRVIRATGRYPWLLEVLPDVLAPVIVVQQIKQRQRVHRVKGEKSDAQR
ncbi:XRE family transcriptional regulator [Herbaspirillum sp. C7C2]|uniref:hypothetical protein n=1 Tax=Herbaspirillum sp. C7C2 TaxID=2736666 RepID=UPI001F519F42|nr:hypothetical protein [Herbaspirillum sp. C7C2]MCI1016251.1 XRE family transcriptional regulator [Herbaspirillum sp. C7C2]